MTDSIDSGFGDSSWDYSVSPSDKTTINTYPVTIINRNIAPIIIPNKYSSMWKINWRVTIQVTCQLNIQVEIQQVFSEPYQMTRKFQSPELSQNQTQMLSSKGTKRQIFLKLFILHIIFNLSSRQRSTCTRRQGSLITSNIGVHAVYYETHYLLSLTKLQIYNKDKH